MCHDGKIGLTYFPWTSDFALYLDTQLVFFHTSFRLREYDQTFDPYILIGHCDLISRFSDFALYLDTQLVYFRTSRLSEYNQTFDPNILIGHCDRISWFDGPCGQAVKSPVS